MFKRLIAMLAVCALLLGGVYMYYDRAGLRTDGIYYQASGIRPDARVMTINGQSISGEEYLYWLDSSCQYLVSYVGGTLDFNAQVTNEMTFGEYAKTDAANTVLLYQTVRQMAQETGTTLTEEDIAALDSQMAEYVSYYGGEEAFRQQLQMLGVTEELLRSVETVPYLYNRMYQSYSSEDGALYPGADVLQAYGEEQGYITVQLLYFPTDGLDENAKADMKAQAADYAAQLDAAADKQALYATLAAQLGLAVNAAGYTFCESESDSSVYQAAAVLAPDEVSDVIEGTSGYYVALGMERNYASLTEDLFNIYLQECTDSAKVEYSKLYDTLDTASFYQELYDIRLAMMQATMS